MNKLRAGFVQFDIKRGRVAHNTKEALQGITMLARARVRLAVLPEMWTSSFSADHVDMLVSESEAAVQEVRKAARKFGMVITGSSYERVGRSIFNTAFVIDADGEVIGSYRKIHLFSPGGEHLNFTSGRTPLLVKTAVGTLGVTICYDLRFPELFRALSSAGAQIIVVPAQWPRERLDHWRTLLRARAIENQVFIIGCNRTGTEQKPSGVRLTFPGHSAVVDPWGRTLETAGRRRAAEWADLDLDVIDAVRKQIPVWTDRRPPAYRIRNTRA